MGTRLRQAESLPLIEGAPRNGGLIGDATRRYAGAAIDGAQFNEANVYQVVFAL